MITDEQRKAFEAWFKENRSSGQMPITKLGSYYLAEHESAWKAWQAAQQIKPLEFIQDDYGDLVAKSPMGKFHVLNMVLSGFVYNGKSYPTEYEAIEAANADYRKRVLSCLVNGGV